MRSNKRGIISEQLYILFGILVVVVFSINAYKFVNGIASESAMQQQFAVRDLAMIGTTASGAPGTLAYVFFMQNSRQKVLPGQLSLAFYDPKTETFLKYAEYFFTYSKNQKFQKSRNLTNSMHIVRNGDEFAFYNAYSKSMGSKDLDCRNYMQTKTIGEFAKNKIVISLRSKENYVKLIAEKIHSGLGGGLATGQNVVLDLDGTMEGGDIFVVLKDENKTSIVLGTPTQETKKLGCMIKDEVGAAEIDQDYHLDLINNPALIKILVKIPQGEDYSSEIASSILGYYHE
ncbi:MAG: hypothetical protein KAT43_01905 [Nanoarchaeota archaeon]|nr:hypothetical protein [Nanoarchaeota archaeon]